MAYKTDLEWFSKLSQFSADEQKVLLALSHEDYEWRSNTRLAEVTGLSSKELDRALAKLIDSGLVRPSISRKKNLIFGLRERVD